MQREYHIVKIIVIFTVVLALMAFSNIESFGQISNLSPQINTGNGIPPSSTTSNGIQTNQLSPINNTNTSVTPCINPQANINPVNGLPLPNTSQINHNSANNVTVPGQNNVPIGNQSNPCSINSTGTNQGISNTQTTLPGGPQSSPLVNNIPGFSG